MHIENLISIAAKVVVMAVAAFYLINFFKDAKKTWVSYAIAFWAIAIVIYQAVLLLKNLSGK